MRLVCPNCDAEYEVDVSAIPESGRDVQCSNCGHGWFQLPPGLEEELAAEEALFEPPPPPAEPPPADAPDEDLPPPPAAAPAVPRALDESLLAVLREEAEREANARRSEAPPVIETQVELGLADPMPEPAAPEPAWAEPSAAAPVESDPVADRIARIKGVAPAAATRPTSRREMLPEIDEINTTLRAASERRGGEAGAVANSLPGAGASSFRSGFLLMILAALVVLALYVMAPKLAQQIPAAKGALESYVGMIDGLRLWLNGLLRG